MHCMHRMQQNLHDSVYDSGTPEVLDLVIPKVYWNHRSCSLYNIIPRCGQSPCGFGANGHSGWRKGDRRRSVEEAGDDGREGQGSLQVGRGA